MQADDLTRFNRKKHFTSPGTYSFVTLTKVTPCPKLAGGELAARIKIINSRGRTYRGSHRRHSSLSPSDIRWLVKHIYPDPLQRETLTLLWEPKTKNHGCLCQTLPRITSQELLARMSRVEEEKSVRSLVEVEGLHIRCFRSFQTQ